MFNVHYEYVDPIAAFRRDHWQCSACLIMTPQQLRGTTDDAAPELDHITPISRGGPHIVENLQCLCRKCNHIKGARTMDEFLVEEYGQPAFSAWLGRYIRLHGQQSWV